MGLFSRKPNLAKLEATRNVNKLVNVLNDQDPQMRWGAAIALERIGPWARPAVPALTKLLRGQSPEVRVHTAIALGKILDRSNIQSLDAFGLLGDMGESSAIIALTNALKDDDFGVRLRAAEALGMIGRKRGVAALIETLKNKDELSFAALIALGKIGDRAAIIPMLKLLMDESPDKRRHAALALEKFSNWSVEPALFKVEKNEDEEKRSIDAWETLGEVRSEALILALAGALDHDNPDVRRNAASALSWIGPDSREAVPSLIKALKDQDDRVRRIAVSALEEIGGDANEAVPGLIDILRDKEEDELTRWDASRALGKIGSDAAVPYLAEALNDRDMRRYAVATLAGLGPDAKAAVTSIMEMARDDDSLIRQRAIAALRKIDGDAAVDTIIERLEDEDQGVREVAVETLGEIGDETIVPALTRALEDQAASVVIRAHYVLAKISGKPKEHIPALAKELGHRDSEVRSKAAQFLGEFRSDAKSAVPNLTRLLYEENPFVWMDAQKALTKITGKTEFKIPIGGGSYYKFGPQREFDNR